MSNSFRTCGITIMPGTIEKDGKLGFNWNLWDMQIVVEDMVVMYLLDDAIEGGWVHMNLVPELVNVHGLSLALILSSCRNKSHSIRMSYLSSISLSHPLSSVVQLLAFLLPSSLCCLDNFPPLSPPFLTRR